MIDTRFTYIDKKNNKKYQELMICTIDDKKYSYVTELNSREKATGKNHVILYTENQEMIFITDEEEKVYILQQMYQNAKDFYKLPAVKLLMLKEIFVWLAVPLAVLFFYISPIISIALIILTVILGSNVLSIRPIEGYLKFKKIEKKISKYEMNHW